VCFTVPHTVPVNRLLHAAFGNFVAANDVSRTSSLAARVSEFMSTPKPRKASAVFGGDDAYGLPVIPYFSARLCQSAQNAYGCRWLSTWLTY